MFWYLQYVFLLTRPKDAIAKLYSVGKKKRLNEIILYLARPRLLHTLLTSNLCQSSGVNIIEKTGNFGFFFYERMIPKPGYIII